MKKYKEGLGWRLLITLLLVCITVVTGKVFVHGADKSIPYKSDEILVKFKNGVSEEAITSINAKIGTRRIKTFRKTGIQHLKLAPGVSVTDTIGAYNLDSNVEYAEPNFIASANRIPNDLEFPNLWGLHNIGQTGGTIDADIDASEAWNVTTGSSSVIVAVIDTGVDYNHEDLSANMWSNSGEIINGIDDDGNGFVDDVRGWDFYNNDNDPLDDNGHGTHCAGTIGAVGNNATGVTGINWVVRIMVLKFLGIDGTGPISGAIDCIEYATDIGVNIMSNSWDIGGNFSHALRDAIITANEAGILFVVAAGNSGTDNDILPNYPSSYDVPNIIAVAATDHNDELASFSCYGAVSVDLAAPGQDILSSIPGNAYTLLSGTSMATPHVSGVAALIKAFFPSLTHLEIKSRIMGGVDSIQTLNGLMVTGGRLNALNGLVVTWEKTYGGSNGEEAYSIQQTTDGGYIVAGIRYPLLDTLSWDIYIVKLDSNGNIMWNKTYGGSEQDVDYFIQQTSDGGYIVAGGTNSFGTAWYSCYIIKLDNNGNIIWEKIYGETSSEAYSIQQTNDGGYVVAGAIWSSFSFGAGGLDFYILKIDSLGNKIWEKTYGGNKNEWARSIQQTTDGSYIVGGETWSFGTGFSDFYIIKLDSNGNKIWEKTYGGSNFDGAYSIQQTIDGGYIVAGGTNSFGAGSFDAYIIKLDGSGNKIWEKTYGGSDSDLVYSIQQTIDGGYITAGYTTSFDVGNGIIGGYIIRLDSDGNKIWEKIYSDDSRSIQPTLDGGYIVSGTKYTLEESSNFHILKLDSLGRIVPYVSSISPISGTNIRPISVIIKGNNFKQGATMGLQKIDEPDIIGYDIDVLSSNEINCTFDLTGVNSGFYDTVVTNPDGVGGGLVESFEVVTGGIQPIISSMELLLEDINYSGVKNLQDYIAKLEASIIKLENAGKYLQTDDINLAFNMLNSTINQLNALINSINAQTNKKIPSDLAQGWITRTKNIISELERIKKEL